MSTSVKSNPIDDALDAHYPKIAAELHRLAYDGKGLAGREMCSRLLEHMVLSGWALIPPKVSK
jgi:hypothetical protein